MQLVIGSQVRVLKRGLHTGEVLFIVAVLVENALYCAAPHKDGRGGIYLRLQDFEVL